MKVDYLENEYVELWIENGIIYEKFKNNLNNITLSAAKKIVDDRLKISNGITRPVLIITNDTISVDKEARIFFSSPLSLSYLSAAALVINNPITMIAAKFLLVFEKPKVKTEIFSDEDKALDWLEKYKKVAP